jgi:small subunit ribosomal protein S19
MAVTFTYKGKTLEELQKMDVREFARYVTARSRRTILRQYDKIDKFKQRAQKKISRNKKIRTHDRDMIIVPQFVGMTIFVYSGKTFEPVKIVEEMIGHYLGEFVLTRKKVEHSAPGIGATRSSAALSVK